MNGVNDYYQEFSEAHQAAARELFRVLTNKDTCKERIVVSGEFRKAFWGDERPFMLSMDALNRQAIAVFKKAEQPITQKTLNRVVMTMRRRMIFVFEKRVKPSPLQKSLKTSGKDAA